MIGYLGPENSFTYFAAASFYIQKELASYKNIYRLFEALNNDEVVGIVVPIENSIDGSITEVLDKLTESDFHINREIVMDIKLSLISKNNDIKKVKTILSNPHALAECRKTLRKKLGRYKEIPTTTTSEAIKKLAKQDDTYGAIASKRAMSRNMNVLLEDIRDSKYNSTRFIFITKSLEVISFHNKTSIVCASKTNKSGALYDILHEFAIRNIDLAKIESRPRKRVLGEYLFYIDFYGNIDDPLIKEALEVIKYKSDLLRILGSYYSKKK